jgi:hypothetical protein
MKMQEGTKADVMKTNFEAVRACGIESELARERMSDAGKIGEEKR